MALDAVIECLLWRRTLALGELDYVLVASLPHGLSALLIVVGLTRQTLFEWNLLIYFLLVQDRVLAVGHRGTGIRTHCHRI